MNSTTQHLPGLTQFRIWMGALLMLAALSFFLTGGAWAATAPANATIGNQASATYFDTAANATRSSTSNTVQTTVAQVYAATLNQSGTQTKPANVQVCYPHSITNNGNGTDNYYLVPPTTGGMFAHTSLAYYADVSPTDGQPDNGVQITSTGPLAAGTTFSFVVCGTTASGATAGQQGTIVVAANDRYTGSGTGMSAITSSPRTDTTTIGNAAVLVQKKLSSVAPPGYTGVTGGTSPNAGPLYVVLDYTNSGTFAANTLTLTDALPAGWVYVAGSGRWSVSGSTALTDANDVSVDPMGISYSVSGTTVTAAISSVPGSTSGSLYFQVTIASGFFPSSTTGLTNAATYSYVDSVTMATTNSTTNNVTYVVTPVVALAFNGASTTTGTTDSEPITVASASPGTTIQWTDYVWHKGNGTVTSTADTYNIQFYDGTGTPIAMGASATFPGANCSPSAMAANACTFPAGTTFQLFASNGMTTLLDSDGDGTPDTGPIPRPSGGMCPAPYIIDMTNTFCGYAVIVKATLPTGTTGNNGGAGYNLSLRAVSKNDNTVTENVPNKLTTIVASTVDLTANLSITGGANAGNAAQSGTPCTGGYVQGTGFGAASSSTTTVRTANCVTPATSTTTVTRFPLWVNNTSAVSAIYNLNAPAFVSVPAGLNATPNGWSVDYRASANGTDCSATTGGSITSTGASPIAAGAAILICAVVTVPSTSTASGNTSATAAPPGNYDIRFGVTNQADGTVQDFLVGEVVIQNLRSLSITPNGMQNVVPGGAVTYTHTLTNNGNVTENVDFGAMCITNSQSMSYSWSATVYIDANSNGVLDVMTDTLVTCGSTTITGLASNATRTLFVRVNAPAMAGSPPNATVLSVSATLMAATITASVTDTTTLTGGTLDLQKYQQTIPTCSGGTPAVTLDSMGIPNAPWTNAAIAASTATQPGKCIAYLVLGYNRTGANINTIVLTDTVPANTNLNTGCGSPSALGPLAVSGSYAAGFTGTVTALSSPTSSTNLPPVNITGGGGTVGSANVAGVVSLQFCVQINP